MKAILVCGGQGIGKIIAQAAMFAEATPFEGKILERLPNESDWDYLQRASSEIYKNAPSVPAHDFMSNRGNYETKINTEKSDKLERLKGLSEKSLRFQPNRFLNKELAKYQFKTKV